MNRIKSLFGLISLVLALMVYPLSTEAQTITVPSGTDISVQLIGQIYIETANKVKETQNINDLPNFATKITEKYAERIDINVMLNNSDRKYLSECMMYIITEGLRLSFKNEGINPDDPDLKPYVNQLLEDTAKQVEVKLAGAKTVGDALPILETVF